MAYWTDFEVFDVKNSIITDMQSMRCSNCKRYVTSPFMYYLDEPKYCPNCGAKMESEGK